ncbi:MAG: electron transport complex subunit RsxA [Candidatus Omnitrophota bacterium]|nr:MAG: electron transport complex subunit RsxA [Candidatus Omnitrophota bacterium]
MFKQFIGVVFSAVLIHNFVLYYCLGICPYAGVSRDSRNSLSMGIAVTFVMSISSLLTYLLYRFLLIPLHIEYLRTIAFILIIATFVQFTEMFIHKTNKTLYQNLGIYLPLITTNCAVLAVAVLNINSFFLKGEAVRYGLLLSFVQGVSAGIGFTLAIFLLATIRERLRLSEIPCSLKGAPITFIVASLLSLTFLGFTGMKVG